MYKEQFKGLEAEEALKVGESVQLGGEVVTVDETPAKKAMPAKFAKKMEYDAWLREHKEEKEKERRVKEQEPASYMLE